MKTINLIVKPDGQTVLETKGFTGTACREASRFLVEALGQVSAEQLTAEFHQAAASQVRQREQQ